MQKLNTARTPGGGGGGGGRRGQQSNSPIWLKGCDGLMRWFLSSITHEDLQCVGASLRVSQQAAAKAARDTEGGGGQQQRWTDRCGKGRRE